MSGTRLNRRHSIMNGHGFLWCDNRVSGGGLDETDLLGCEHCQCTIRKDVWLKDPTWCPRCDKAVCLNCHGRIALHGCEPFRMQIEQQLNEKYRREQNARILGT